MDYKRDLYKHSRAGAIEKARAKRSAWLSSVRDAGRMKLLEEKRTISEDKENSVEKVPEPKPVKGKDTSKKRFELLKQWKAERQKKIENLKTKQKPVFKVGVVHYKISGSPATNVDNTYGAKNFLKPKQTLRTKAVKETITTNNGVVTRSQAKLQSGLGSTANKPQNIFQQIISNKKRPILNHKFVVPKAVKQLTYQQKITVPISPNITKSSFKMIFNNEQHGNNVKKTLNFGRSEAKNEPLIKAADSSTADCGKENEIPEVKGREDEFANGKREEQEPEVSSSSPLPNADFVPIHYSPFVTKFRGSHRRSKSVKKTLEEKVEEAIEKEAKEFACRIYSHKKFLESETKRLHGKCDEWKAISSTNRNLPSEVEGEIASVVGKTNLLTSDKFKQFHDLIDKCEKNDPMVKIDDLQGFQDWVTIEVENIDNVFYKLSQMKENGFKTETEVIKKEKPLKQNIKKTNIVEKKPAKPVSNMRAHILAARKLMQQNPGSPDMKEVLKLETASPKKIFTPKKSNNLVRSVLHSETKRRNSGFEIIMATHRAKALTPSKNTSCNESLNESLTFINQDKEPSRSILKTKKTPSSMKRSVVFSMADSQAKYKAAINEKYFLRNTRDSLNLSPDDTTMSKIKVSSTPKQNGSGLIRQTRRKAVIDEKYFLPHHLDSEDSLNGSMNFSPDRTAMAKMMTVSSPKPNPSLAKSPSRKAVIDEKYFLPHHCDSEDSLNLSPEITAMARMTVSSMPKQNQSGSERKSRRLRAYMNDSSDCNVSSTPSLSARKKKYFKDGPIRRSSRLAKSLAMT